MRRIDMTTAKNTPPAIGEIWPGQGGIYCGIARGEDGQPDYHLILAVEAPGRLFNWREAMAHAETIQVDGCADFRLPTRFESALLYANVRDKFDRDWWHWTRTQTSERSAFDQNFYDGNQYNSGKGFKGRVRFVRSVPIGGAA